MLTAVVGDYGKMALIHVQDDNCVENVISSGKSECSQTSSQLIFTPPEVEPGLYQEENQSKQISKPKTCSICTKKENGLIFFCFTKVQIIVNRFKRKVERIKCDLYTMVWSVKPVDYSLKVQFHEESSLSA